MYAESKYDQEGWNQPRRIRQPRRKAMLVYQAGIANVFMVACFNLAPFGREACRVYQGDYHTAAAIAFGLGLAGVVVRTAACNRAGNIVNETWSDNLEEQPFSDKFELAFYN